ncbi:MAG: hypothetical protein OQK82_06080, partial [Candidatus Pacearchaeota archaeon]|nr:hypothetical protein [Candidatus Pacearchaeota archaeon]
ILRDLKKEMNESIVLIPVGVDGGLESVNLMVENFGVESLPVVIINNEEVVTELKSVDELKELLKD